MSLGWRARPPAERPAGEGQGRKVQGQSIAEPERILESVCEFHAHALGMERYSASSGGRDATPEMRYSHRTSVGITKYSEVDVHRISTHRSGSSSGIAYSSAKTTSSLASIPPGAAAAAAAAS